MKTLAMDSLPIYDQKASQINGVGALHRLDPFDATNFVTNTAWRAFQDGMKALYQYAGRSRADPILIAKANLRLLHRALLADTSYRERLTAAEHETPKNGFPTAHNLLTIQGLRADLITLQPGCDTQITSCSQYNTMVMVITGEVAIDPATTLLAENNQPVQHRTIQRKSWWQRLPFSSNEHGYRQGDIFLLGPDDHSDKMLCALKHHCVLLKLSLSVDQHAASH